MDALVNNFVQTFSWGPDHPAPLQHWPSEQGLEFETVWFPSVKDNVTLEGWYIPCKGSKKLIIANHPMTFNKGGFPGTLPGYDTFDPIDVNFIPDLKALYDAGYAVLTYDLRNHGRSWNGWGSSMSIGNNEARDVLGSLAYARQHPEMKNMEIGLLSRCMGADSTIYAMRDDPAAFKDVKCMIALQPVSIETFVVTAAKNMGLDPKEACRRVDEGVFNQTGWRLEQFSPQRAASAVTIPTKVVQVKDDRLIDAPKDTQEIFDAMSSKDKELYWIEGTVHRFDGYNFFGKDPKVMLDWFNKWM